MKKIFFAFLFLFFCFDANQTFATSRDFSGASFENGSAPVATTNNFLRASFENGSAQNVLPSIFITVPESPFGVRELWQNGTVEFVNDFSVTEKTSAEKTKVGEKNSEEKNSEEKSSGEKSSDEKSSGEKSSDEKNSVGEKNSDEKNFTEKNSGEKNSEEKNSGEKSSDEKNSDEKNFDEKNSDEKNSGEKKIGEKNSGEKSSDEKNSGEKSFDEKNFEEKNSKNSDEEKNVDEKKFEEKNSDEKIPPTPDLIREIPARIRGRGNATWNMGENKRPLRVRFDEARSVFGSEYAARDWILLADNFDRSLMRNFAALNLARAMGNFRFTPTAQHVHLYVNRQYMGVYLLTDEREVGAGRLEISADDFFIELDGRANEPFFTANHLTYRVRFPRGGALTPERVDFAREFLEKVSRTIRFGEFDEILKLIDLETFVDFYIVQEFFKNPDAHGLSIFMHISDGRLFMGPVWDFDMAAGNSDSQMMGNDPQGLYVAVFNYWYRNLMSRPEFFDAVATRWKNIRETEITQIIAEIKNISSFRQSQFERNFVRHPIPQSFLREDLRRITRFWGQIEFLTRWLEERATWLDNFFDGELEYDQMFELVEYFREFPVRVDVNDLPHEFEIFPIRLPYAVKITTPEIEKMFGLRMSENSVGAMIFSDDEIKISHTIGTNSFFVARENQKIIAVESSAPSIKIGENIFVPIRVIAEIMGFEVEWDEEKKLVTLS